MKPPGERVGGDATINLLASDDEDTMDERLAAIPLDEPPVQLPAAVAELLAGTRNRRHPLPFRRIAA